jgi:beta-fructofuranosidase
VLYTPPDRDLILWDTWLFRHGDEIHLFHLQRERHEIGCSSIGHAVSRDWFHWDTLPLVLAQGTGSAWDAGPLMTGMTIAHDGRYYLFYGAMVDRVQRIGLAVSDDLVHWQKLGTNPVLEPAGPWYETDPARANNYETAWRDPYVFYDQARASFFALICARVAGSPDVGGGCIAVARSSDLLTWELLPPAHVSEALTCLEVPEYFSRDGRHYLTYTSSYHFGTPYPLKDAFQTSGTFYLVSDDMLNGYHEPDHPNILHAGLPNAVTNYVGRSLPLSPPAANRRYYYHNVFPPKPGQSLGGSLSLPKLLGSRSDGRLAVQYDHALIAPHVEPVETLDAPLSPARALALVEPSLPDGILSATVDAAYTGLSFRLGPGREQVLEGSAVWLTPSHQDNRQWYVVLGSIHFPPGPLGRRPVLGDPAALRALDPDLHPDGPPRARLTVVYRGPCTDVFVDDILYLSHTTDPDAPPQGQRAGAFYAGQPKPSPVARFEASRFRQR